jgi:hypothetical protein
MADAKVVDAKNENRVLFHGTDDAARDFVENNFPRHHVDPASPVMETAVPDVYLITSTGKKEQYLGPEDIGDWSTVGEPPPARKAAS